MDTPRRLAMTQLGAGLFKTGHYEEALSVYEAELSMKKRLGLSEVMLLGVMSNIALTYGLIGRKEQALQMRRDVYSGYLRLYGEEHEWTLMPAHNYAASLVCLKRFEEAKALLRKMIPVARRVLGESHDLTLRIRSVYAEALCNDPDATLDDLREAVSTLEDTGRIARRVLGGTHPLTGVIEHAVQASRVVLRARETGDVSSLREGMEALREGMEALGLSRAT